MKSVIKVTFSFLDMLMATWYDEWTV